MTETMTQTMTDNIASLKAAVREASQHERVLALEVDALPQRVQQAARQDARNKAKAAREDAEIAAVDADSEIPQLRQREKDLPYLRWSAAIRHAALEAELYDAQVQHHEAEAVKARSGLEGHVGAADRLRDYRSKAADRLRLLEQEYPNA
jgi:hypothetical protein